MFSNAKQKLLQWRGKRSPSRKGPHSISKMTPMSQDEIVSNTKTVLQGLEALKIEHNSILSGLLSSMEIVQKERADGRNPLMEEKACIIKKHIDSIELGLGEAQVMVALANHLQAVEAEKQKLRAQVRRLCQENAWLRDELANTQQKLQTSEQLVAQIEEEKKQLEFMNSLKVYDNSDSMEEQTLVKKEESEQPLDLCFPDDDDGSHQESMAVTV